MAISRDGMMINQLDFGFPIPFSDNPRGFKTLERMRGIRQHLSNVHIKFCDKGCAGKSGREALMDLLIEGVMNLLRLLTPLQTRIKWYAIGAGLMVLSLRCIDILKPL